MSPRPRICILSLEKVHQDGRVLRQIEYASRAYDVTVVGWGRLDTPRDNVQMKPVEPKVFSPVQRQFQAALMAAGRLSPAYWERWYWRKPDHREALRLVSGTPCDLLHIDEAIALPIGIRAAEQLRCKVLFDAHEYSPGQDTDKLWWRMLAQPFYTYLIRHYATQADAMTTVALGIAEHYRREFGLSPSVIMNTPEYIALPFHPVDPEHIRIVHHATAVRDRQLEQMIDVVALTGKRFSLEFMLLEKDTAYIEELRQRAQERAPGRITFRPSVAPAKIAPTINAYDIGLHLLPPINFNTAHALPNKFFEFIMAGLALAIGPSPEMMRIVREHGVGAVGASFEPEELAARLDALQPDEINEMKRRSLEAAKIYNAAAEMGKLMSLYAKVLQ
jgi:hypothetical protein